MTRRTINSTRRRLTAHELRRASMPKRGADSWIVTSFVCPECNAESAIVTRVLVPHPRPSPLRRPQV